MKIWFTEIGEPLPIEENARLHRYGTLTRILARLGHDIVWWTSNFSHAKKAFVCNGNCEKVIDGVTLRILDGPGYARNVSLARFRHQSQFARTFSREASACALPDLIVSPIPTIETAYLAVHFANERHIPILTDIRDEWPDDLVNVAPKPLRPLGKLLLRSYFVRMRHVCQNVTGIMAISQRQLNYGLKFAGRTQRETDGVFPHGYSIESQQDEKAKAMEAWWRGQGVKPESFIVCFFGTIGRFFDLETVIQAARILESEFDIQFVLCGDGSSLSHYQKMASGTRSVLFPGWMDKDQIASLMRLASVGLAPYAGSALTMSLPNKPFEYLAGGLPVVSSIQGELRDLLEANHCGFTYRDQAVPDLCQILRELHINRDKRKEMGARGARLVREQFSFEVIGRKLSDHFLKVIDQHRAKNSH